MNTCRCGTPLATINDMTHCPHCDNPCEQRDCDHCSNNKTVA